MPSRNQHPSAPQTGFSLVEIMVGMAIGLLATLVIMQVFSVFEEQKRATSGSAGAQTNGSVALYSIGRDLQMAGFGLLPTENSPLECNPRPTVDHDSNAATPAIDLSPVIITDGGAAAGASDTIAIRYGGSPMGGAPSPITALAGTAATVDNNFACQVNDIALLINGTACAMTWVNALTATTGITLASATGAAVGVSLNCLGAWQEFIYSVAGGNLTLNGVASVPEIVNLQAQYGISASANSNQVVQWVDATAATGWNAPTVANQNRIKAIRIAVVARNGQLEKTNVTAACSSTTAAAPTGLCAWDATTALPNPVIAPFVASPAPTIDLSNDADWQRYRYRVFETIIPLRNTIWSKDTL